MKFSEKFTQLIGMEYGKRTDIARSLGVSVPYIIDVAAGRKKAPSPERCHQIAKALKLDKNEEDCLVYLAAEERVSPDILKIIKDHSPCVKKVVVHIHDNGEVETIADPGIAVIIKYPDDHEARILPPPHPRKHRKVAHQRP
jgi:transcriptional regulator with XRE-family HTH domain